MSPPAYISWRQMVRLLVWIAVPLLAFSWRLGVLETRLAQLEGDMQKVSILVQHRRAR